MSVTIVYPMDNPNRHKIITIEFEGSNGKTYDYLFINRSGHRIQANQVIKHINTGKKMIIRHLNFTNIKPSHVTKRLILQEGNVAYTEFIGG